jgi:hypothetical protein
MGLVGKLDTAGQAVLEQVSRIAEAVIGPAAAAMDQEARFPKEGLQVLCSVGRLGLGSVPYASASASSRWWSGPSSPMPATDASGVSSPAGVLCPRKACVTWNHGSLLFGPYVADKGTVAP